VAAFVWGIGGVAAGPVAAATVERFGDVVYYQGGGEANDLHVSSADGIVFRDTGAVIQAGEGCEPLADGTVTCGSGESPWLDPSRIEIHLGDGDDRAASEIENLSTREIDTYGGRGRDTVYSGSGSGLVHLLVGGPGDDNLSTSTNNIGRSTFVGGSGNDVLRNQEGGRSWFYGGGGDDVIFVAGMGGWPVLMDGGRGSDFYDAWPGGDGNGIDRTIRPGPGRDTLQVRSSDYPLVVDLVACGGCVENVIGTPYEDTLLGDAKANVLIGGGGNDTIDPRGGHDRVAGDDGDDRIDLRDGERDRATCGAGDDQVDADTTPADSVSPDCEQITRIDRSTSWYSHHRTQAHMAALRSYAVREWR
jgi:Ca2+-binding RTX toxin-like protein